jgi:outer membrane receptor protein involved in Fe transport
MAPLAAQAQEGGGDIVVTGSRIVQNGNNMPTPVTVVSTDQLLQTVPKTVVEALQQLPVFNGGRNQTTQPGNGGGNGVGRNLNLRNVGATRTLVLFDGIRVPPTTQGGEVNADFVPSMLLQRVDVVTGGASAVYGSDAVAGVVNFITDRNYNGLKVDASLGRSELGDADEMKFGIAAGKELFNGRGHIEGSYEYFNAPGVFSKLKRDWAKKVYSVQGAGTAAAPVVLVENTRLTRSSNFGLISGVGTTNAGNPLRDMVFRSNGVLSPFQHGTAIPGTTAAESGGDGAYFFNASLQNLFQSDLGYGRFDFDLTDSVHFYAQGTGMLSHVKNNHESVETTAVTLSASNAFLAPEYQQQMLAANRTTFAFQKFITQVDAKSPESYIKAYMANVGLEGQIADWNWNVGYLNSANSQNTRLNRNINNGRFIAAADAVRAPNGQIVCNVTLTNPGLYPGCVPINLFGPTSESAEALNYVLGTTSFETTTKMDTVSGAITGSPFSTWAGEVGVAASAEYRKLTYQLMSSIGDNAKLNCTGLRFNCTQGTTNGWLNDVRADRTEVSQSVKEAAGEINVPLLRDVPLAESLVVNGAVRLTDYSNSGTVTTWKIGTDWDINSQLTLRATRSRDIRAPNLTELFGTQSVTPAGPGIDLHVGNTPAGIVSLITDSNPNLVPEVASTWTAGAVFRPSFIPGFSLAVDWYSIEIADAIAGISGRDLVIQRICEESGGTSPTCAQAIRPLPFSDKTTANYATGWITKPQNLASFRTNGVDFEANYRFDALGGNISTRLLGTYQPTSEQENFPGALVLNSAGAALQPVWRVVGFVKYQRGDWSLDVQERWWSSTKWNADPTIVYNVAGDLPAVAYTNATLGYRSGPANYFFSIQNLFNKQPTPYGAFGGASTVPGLFGGFYNGEDTIGRYYTVGVRLRY